MPLLLFIIVGIAAGFLATRLLRMETDLLTTCALGIFGALIGGLLLRSLATMAGWASGFVGAVLGAVVLALLWRWFSKGRGGDV